MSNTQLTIEILQLIFSLLTPLLVLTFGLIISNKIERTKLSVLKEKEWQVKWAEMFLKHATDFNDNISTVICSLFSIQNEKKQTKIDEIINKISITSNMLSEIDWNIRNYAQFSERYGCEVLTNQETLMSMIRSLISNRQGSLEDIRKQQFIYNSFVRKTHNEILNSK